MDKSDDPPVKMGETYVVSINALGEKGDGIARVKGFVLFVSKVQKGDYVRIKVTKVLPKVGFAEAIEKLERPEKMKYATVTEEELKRPEESSQQYEDTDNFGDA